MFLQSGWRLIRPLVAFLFLTIASVLSVASAAQAQPLFATNFNPTPIGPGGTSTLTYTITNGSAAPVTGLAFTNTLPIAPGPLVIATPANASTTCGGEGGAALATVSAPDGGGTVTFSAGQIAASTSCTVTVDVTASTPGAHTNPAVTLSSSAGSSMSLSVDLTVTTVLPGFSQSFAPSSISIGARSTLTFTIDNSANASVLGFLNFSNTLPAGISIADPANASSTCGGPNPTLTVDAGSGTISFFSFGFAFPGFEVLAAGATCTVTLDVNGVTLGDHVNISGELTLNPGSAGSSSAILSVTGAAADAPLITKSFTDDPVVAGNSATLDFTITNTSRTDTATDITFIDDLFAMQSSAIFTSLLSNDCGGVISGVGAQNITLTGGVIAPEASCSISTLVTLSSATATGSFPNVTTAVTATVGGAPVIGNVASDTLHIQGLDAAPPVVSLSFTDGVQGGTLVGTFNVTNPSTSALTNLAISTPFPSDVFATASVTPANGDCGAGSTFSFTPAFNPQPPSSVIPATLSLTGGAIAAGNSCNFSITLDVLPAASAGPFSATTDTPTATVGGTAVTAAPATGTGNIGAGGGGLSMQLEKSFSVASALSGDTIGMDFVITNNPESTGTAIDVGFTDDLAAFLPGTTVNLPPVSNDCGASVIGSAGDSFLTVSGGTLAVGASCTISTTITLGTGSGTATNATSTLMADVSGGSGAGTVAGGAQAQIDVFDAASPVLSMEFTDDPVIAGDQATLRFTIDNPVSGGTVTSFSFTNDLSAILPGGSNVAVVSGAPGTDICGAGSAITLIGPTFLNFVGGNLIAGTSCSFDLVLTIPAGTADGTYGNTTGTPSAVVNGILRILGVASDALTVQSGQLLFSKEFTDDPVAPGGTATLEFTVENLSGAAASGIAFTDDLTAMLAGTTFDSLLSNDCGGSLSGTGTPMITATGGALAAGSTCVIRVSITIAAGAPTGTHTNTTSDLSGTIGGFAVSGDAASDNLVVAAAGAATFSKAFAGPVQPSDTTQLTFTIDNTDAAAVGLSALQFNDDLGAMLPGATGGAVTTNTCGGTLGGASLLTYTGGSVAAGATCTIVVDVTIPASATAGSYPNTTSDLTISGLSVASAATANLTVEPAPAFAKAFGPATITQGGVSTLTFTIDNAASSLDALSLAFTDNLPAAMTVAPAPTLTNSCGGTLTAAGGSNSISLAGGSVIAGEGCTLSVTVTSIVVGSHVNTTGDLTSTGGNSGTATDTLVVDPASASGFSKSFSPSSIAQGAVSTLTFTIDNSTANIDATALDFTDTFPAGLTIAAPANSTTTCTGGTITAATGSGSISYTGGTVSANATCTVDVDVTSTTLGNALNTSGDLTSSLGNSGPASATLSVTAAPAPGFTQAFVPPTITQSQVSSLVFTIDNGTALIAASALNFSNTLPANVTVAAAPNPNTTCGGTVTATAGTGSIAFSGGTVAASATCQLSVDVTSNIVGVYPNTPGNLSSSLGSSTPGAASLTVNADPSGQVTFIQQSVEDAAFGFSSGEAALNFTINTTGGTGSAGPISVLAGSYTVTQSAPAGVGNSSITCSDNDSTGNAATGVITLNVAAFETLTCTISSVDSRQKTVDTINSFLNRRNNLILSNQPSRSRRMDRLRNGGTGVQRLSYQNGDLESMLPFSLNFQSLGTGNYQFSTSVTQAMTGHAKFRMAHDGEPDASRLINNHKLDVWFEASHNKFEASQGSGGHFTIAYLGADYLVSPNFLAGALIQYDELNDSSAQTNSTVEGKGWMIGPYITTELAPNLYFDGRIAYGKSRNRISPFNTYTDTFRTDRWMVNANLSGNFELDTWQMSPNINLAYIEEYQHGYIDSLSIFIPSQTVGLGQLRFGPDFSTVIYGANHWIIEPRFTIDGIYNFGDRSGNALVNDTSNEADGWRARIETEVALTNRHGTRLQFGVNYDGVGQSDFESYGLSFKVTVPLN